MADLLCVVTSRSLLGHSSTQNHGWTSQNQAVHSIKTAASPWPPTTVRQACSSLHCSLINYNHSNIIRLSQVLKCEFFLKDEEYKTQKEYVAAHTPITAGLILFLTV